MPDKKTATDYAAPFSDMAARILHNESSEFCGAFVIVPPKGDPISMVLFDPKQEALAFWSLVKTRADIAADEAVHEMDKNSASPWNAQRGGR